MQQTSTQFQKQQRIKMTPQETADRLRELRLQCGLSRDKLAYQAGVSTSVIGQIERGIRPSQATCDRIEKVIKGQLEWIAGQAT